VTSEISAARDDRTSESGEESSVLDPLIVLAERKLLIFWCTVSFALVAFVVSLLLPVLYTATVTILPPQQGSSIDAALTSQLGNLGTMAQLAGNSFGIKNPNDMYVAMLKSRTVEDAMVQRYGLQQEYHKKLLSDARKEFEENTNINGSGKDGLIYISIIDEDPKRAAELASGYVEQLHSLSANVAITEAAQRRLFFQNQLKETKNRLASADEVLRSTQERTGMIEVSSQTSALLESTVSLRAKIAAQEVLISGLQTYASGQNSQLIEAQQELNGLRGQLAQLGGSRSSGDDLILPKGKVPGASLEYLHKLRDVKYQEAIFDILARQYELAELDEAKGGSVFQVVDPAPPPDRRSFPHRGLIVICATITGFLVGALLAFAQLEFKSMQANPRMKVKLETLKASLRSF
jgi:tyrosine-protein kinase Etk/Wzc